MFFDDVAEYPLVQDYSQDTLVNMLAWLDRYLEFLEIEKVSPKTKKAYHEALQSFMNFIKKHKNTILMDQIGAKFINRYLNNYQFIIAKKALEKENITKEKFHLVSKQNRARNLGKNDANFEVLEQFQSTITQRLTVLKMFLKFITENNKDLHDYVKVFPQLVKVKIQEKDTPYLTANELETVISFMYKWPTIYKKHKPKSSLRYAYRDALLLLIYALSGARSEEVVHIKLEDIKEMQHKGEDFYVIKLTHAKGGKLRNISIKKHYIEEYIEYFIDNLPHKGYYLSSTYMHNQYINKVYHPNNIRKFANFILKLLNINKSGLHTFRRGYATKRLIVDNANISLVAKEIGNTPEILHKHYFKHNVEDIMDSQG